MSDRKLRDAHGARRGRVHDDDPPGGRRRHVDVVHADAGPADDFEARAAVQNVFRNFRPAPHDEGMVGGNRTEQRLRVEFLHGDLVSFSEHDDRLRFEAVRDQDFHWRRGMNAFG